MNGLFEIGLVSAICLIIFGHGLYMSRVRENPWAGKPGLTMRPMGARNMSPQDIRTHGRIQMAVAGLAYCLILAAIFGVFGPMKGLYIIHLG